MAEAKVESTVTQPEVKEAPVVEQAEKKEEVDTKEPIVQKLDGIKQIATNFDAIKGIKDGEAKTDALPSFFINTEEKQRIEVDILFDKSNGKVLSISKTGLGLDFKEFESLGHTIEWFDFTQPTYDDIANYRQRCNVYNNKAGKAIIDGVQLRNFFIVWHLKDWSLRDNKGQKVLLAFNENGSLDSDTVTRVYKIFPTLMDVIMTLFEKDILLT